MALLGAQAYGQNQCTRCTPDRSQIALPRGFNPDTLRLPPGVDTTLVVHFTFPDSVRRGQFVLYPNYAIWVDSMRLDSNRVRDRNGNNFAYDSSNPEAGPIHFDQDHRTKPYEPNNPNTARFVVYRNPSPQEWGSGGSAGNTPPYGCARLCIRTVNQEGSDTLRVRVRFFIPQGALGTDGNNKDTTSVYTPDVLGNRTYGDTVFRYVVKITRNLQTHAGYVGSYSVQLRLSPNPAWGETELRFILMSPTRVSLRAFTIDGREVYLHESLYAAGEHRHSLRLPKGIYTILLETEYGRVAERLVMLE
ncbi:MAG: T9SS type A sorting domain-containing protein [Bacteroidia bacterium]|nr:T9SS type A sorting domain-containing protein [Bacteroidia bacterium]